MTPEQEKTKLKELQQQGYTVEVCDPTAVEFHHKYSIYRDMPPLGKRYSIMNAKGEIIGHQG